MSELHFIGQQATQNILLRVTNVCSECYSDLHENDEIYYDTHKYHYICQSCYERLSEEYVQSDEGQSVDADDALFTSLF